jgi:hypothetical protein
MAESYRVLIDALENHARTLSGLSRELTGVHGKADAVELPSDAYGETAAQAAALVRGHTYVGQTTLEAAAAALDAVAATIRANAAEYESTERQNTDTLNRAGGRR